MSLPESSTTMFTGFQQAADNLKEDFLNEYGDSYGCGGAVELAREQDLRRLKGSVYLDFAGAVPYSDSQLASSLERMSNNLQLNPHR